MTLSQLLSCLSLTFRLQFRLVIVCVCVFYNVLEFQTSAQKTRVCACVCACVCVCVCLFVLPLANQPGHLPGLASFESLGANLCQDEKESAHVEVTTRKINSKGKITDAGKRPKVWIDDVNDCIQFEVSKIPGPVPELALVKCRATLISIALEFCFATSIKMNGTVFNTWSSLRAHLQSLVPKFLASPGSIGSTAGSDGSVKDSLLDALVEVNELESVGLDESLSATPADKKKGMNKDDVLKDLLQSEPRMNVLREMVTSGIEHSKPVRTHKLFAKFRTLMEEPFGQLTAGHNASEEMSRAIANSLFNEDVFGKDWQIMAASIQDNVAAGTVPEWMSALIPLAHIPYMLAVREKYAVEILHEALQLDEDELALQDCVRARWKTLIRSARKPTVGKVAVLDFIEAIGKRSIEVDEGTYAQVWQKILDSGLDENSASADIAKLKKEVVAIISPLPPTAIVAASPGDTPKQQEPESLGERVAGQPFQARGF